MPSEKYNGQKIDVTDKGQVIDVGSVGESYTLLTEDANAVYYRSVTGNHTALNDAADSTALRALNCSELQRGEPIVVTGGQMEIVCIDAQTSTLRIEAGIQIAAIDATLTIATVNSDLDSINGNSVNVSSGAVDSGTLVVNQASNGVIATAFGAVGVDSSKVGVVHAQLRYLGEAVDGVKAAVHSTNSTPGGGDTLMGIVAVRKDTRAFPATAANGTYTALQTTSTGDLRVRDDDLITNLGSASSDSSVTGDIHGKLRYIGTNTASLVTAGGGGYIRQDSTATIALEAGGNLAAIVTALAGGGTLAEKAPTWVTIEITTAGTALPFAAEGTYATYVGVEALKKGGPNTDVIYIKNSDVSGIATLDLGHPVGVGGTWEYRSRPGTKFDLNDFYFDCKTGNTDGIVFVYEPA